jgi:hypothetical protein
MAAPQATWTQATRGSALWLGLVTVVVLAGLVTLGTTAPLLTMIAGKPANVQPAYYQQIIIPLGFAILFLMAVAPALRWSRQEKRSWLSTLVPAVVVGLIVLAWGLVSGMRAAGSLALATAAGAALGMNLWMMTSLFRRGWRYGAGALGHFGIAVMALGMLISGALGKTERLRLHEGESVEVFGRHLTYRGTEPGPMGASILRFTVAGRDGSFEARPRLLPAQHGEGMIHTPAISVWREIYISPLELQEIPTVASMSDASTAPVESSAPSQADAAPAAAPGVPSVIWLERDHATPVGDATLTFRKFQMEGGEHLRVLAEIDLTRGGKTTAIAPAVEAGPRGMQGVPLEVPGIGPLIVLKIDADHGRVAVHAPMLSGTAAAAQGVRAMAGLAQASPVAPPPSEVTRYALFEIQTKPLINLVWIGALLTLVGTALAGLRRAGHEQVLARATGSTAAPKTSAS